MLRHVPRNLLVITIAFGIIFLSTKTQAKIISGYEELIPLFAKGSSQQEQQLLQKSIMRAESEAISDIFKKELNLSENEANKFIRKAKESVPTRFFKFNNKYAAIGFEKKIFLKSYWEKIAFVMLFEIKGPVEIIYLDKYQAWKGKSVDSNYDRITGKQLCMDFASVTGMDDCIAVDPETKEKVVLLDKKVNSMNEKLNSLDALIKTKAAKNHKHSGSDINSGKVKMKYISTSVATDSELAGALAKLPGGKAKTAIDVSYVKELEKKVAQLEKTVKKLTTLLEGVSRKKNEITFSGVNVHIVSGSGSTEGTVNGLGNLIVGYNETRTDGHVSEHTGSHNIIVGSKHSYTSYGGIVVGSSNTISGKYSSVCAGQWNTANGDYSSVSGGHLNSAKGNYSSIPGGLSETTKDENACGGCK